ncbi:MAG: AsmA-like C-terminal region-containing protein [Isosphaeraceae bacterium]|nr:AsmA-like C-terminal region-containing protein [Isosphaeraceae bacterium]
MKLLGMRRWRLILLALVLGPPLLWALVLALVPTAWARDRIVARLQQATGQPVRLVGLRLGALGGVRLQGLEIGPPVAEKGDGPWLRVSALRIDLNLAQLALGHLEPGLIEADGVALRIYRRADGSFEFGDLLRAGPEKTSPEKTTAAAEDPERSITAFRLHDAKISLIDEPTATRLDFSEVEGHGTWQRQRVEIAEVKGALNGGRFAMAGALERGGPAPAFDGQVRAERVALGVGMKALGYLVPLLAGMPASVEGRLDLNLYLKGRGASSGEILRSLSGQGTVALDPIALDGSQVLAELSQLIALPDRERVGSIRSSLAIGQGRIISKDLTLTVAQVPIRLAGWTDFQGRLDYQVRAEGLMDRLSSEAKGLLGDLPIDLKELVALRIEGTLDHLVVSADGVPVTDLLSRDPARRAEERAKLREFGRRLRDRILR